jgi:hypothetical protein
MGAQGSRQDAETAFRAALHDVRGQLTLLLTTLELASEGVPPTLPRLGVDLAEARIASRRLAELVEILAAAHAASRGDA